MHPIPKAHPMSTNMKPFGGLGVSRANRLMLLLLVPIVVGLVGAAYVIRATAPGLHKQHIRGAIRAYRENSRSLECNLCPLLCLEGTNSSSLTNPDARSASRRLDENVHTRVYEFSCLQVNPCTRERPLLAIVVIVSGPSNGARRDRIRLTWASEASKLDMAVVFLVGLTADNRTNQAVGAEALHHGDMIIVNFTESYGLLTVKSVAMLKWATKFCRQSRYLAKIDDDVFVSLSHLKAVLIRHSNVSRAIIGRLINGSLVVKEPRHKWANPYFVKHYGTTYPSYLCGTAYIISMDIVPELYEASQLEPFDPMEDVFITGICPTKIGNVTIIAHKGFKPSRNSARVFLNTDVVAAHDLRPEDMTAYWKYLTRQARLASSKGPSTVITLAAADGAKMPG